MDKTKFGSLWVGATLSKLEEICLSSFLHHGHEFNLFVYDLDLIVPYGVIKHDARKIIPELDIFKVKDAYAPFSDLFRYQMIQKTGFTWVDTDIICFSSDWSFKDSTYFGYELDSITGCVLSLPQDSPALQYIIDESIRYDKSKIIWTEIGSILLTEAFSIYGLMPYAQSQETFCGISYLEWEKLWDPRCLNEIKTLETNNKSISLFTSMIKWSLKNKDLLPEGSAIDYFYKKYVLNCQI